MGYYVNQKCGSCRKSLTGGFVPNYSGIGPSHIVCKRCGAVNDNSARMEEWNQKSTPRQVSFVLGHLFSTLLYFGFGSVTVGSILLAENIIHTTAGFVAIAGSIFGFGLLRFFIRLPRMIRVSNARTSGLDDYAA